ncbi:MAG TPA: hypothetical protein VK208_20960, partial [Pyrinomonadaceae bacterium]|nr:hypothetical protein [Pyrinomonadaceae bacterium]
CGPRIKSNRVKARRLARGIKLPRKRWGNSGADNASNGMSRGAESPDHRANARSADSGALTLMGQISGQMSQPKM